MGGKSGQVAGYRYYFGIHMGLNRGEIDELVEIKVGDRTAWSGSVTTNSTIHVNAPNLFGGDDGEGGIDGQLAVMTGGPAQTVNPELESMLGGLVPAFRGVTSLFFDGQICANNPYPKPWKVRRRRALKGWDGPVWNSSKAVISLASGAIKAMNPAHILYECWTNRDWGRGLNAARLDATSFGAAADTFYSEAFGLCLRWTRQDTVKNFMLAVLNHAGAACYPDRSTGLIKLVPIRDDYDPEDLPLYTFNNGLLGIDDDDNAAASAGINVLIVQYRDPITNQVGRVRVPNVASIQAVGAKFTETREYPGLPTPQLALRVGQRDLRAASGFLKGFKLRFDRRAYGEAPASVFRISDPTRGIQNMVLRAARIDEADGTDGTITIRAAQDVFGLPATAYVTPQASGWIPPNRVPTAVATRRLIELPYRDLVSMMDAANFALVASTAGYLSTLALRPTGLSMGYGIATRVGMSGAFTERADGSFCPSATLATSLSITGTSATLNNRQDLSLVAVGSAALVDDEVIRIDTIDASTGAITFARGCADTVRASHSSAARVWFFETYAGRDPTEYTDGNTVQAKLLTNTSTGQLAEGSAGTDSLVMDQRQYRPYPPGRLRINTASYPASITGDLAVAWAHRDRVTQADQLVDDEQTSIGPEATVTYTLRIYSGVTLKRTYSGISGTSQTYSNADELADGGPFNPVRFTLHAVRGGLESTQGHDVTVGRI